MQTMMFFIGILHQLECAFEADTHRAAPHGGTPDKGRRWRGGASAPKCFASPEKRIFIPLRIKCITAADARGTFGIGQAGHALGSFDEASRVIAIPEFLGQT